MNGNTRQSYHCFVFGKSQYREKDVLQTFAWISSNSAALFPLLLRASPTLLLECAQSTALCLPCCVPKVCRCRNNSHHRRLTISFTDTFLCCQLCSPAERKSKQMYGKIRIVKSRHFHMRLHVSNFGIQFLSRNIKVFSS